MSVHFGEKEYQALLTAKDLFLFLDCDGTLCPITRRYDEAVFPLTSRDTLKRLSKLSHIRIAVISGRSLEDLERFIKLKGIIYSGNHGIEIKRGSQVWIYPAARNVRHLIQKMIRQINRELPAYPGILLEDKHYTLSCHYRLADPRTAKRFYKRLQEITRHYLVCRQLRLSRGKKVWEIRPFFPWHKGKAVCLLLSKISKKKCLPVFIGDDTTDEDAFRELAGGITIRVGRRKDTAAKCFLQNYSEVVRLLEAVYEGRKKNEIL
jgi:trehalose-phosphatase